MEDYIAFMCDPSNSHCCENCPENRDMAAWPEYRLPCGQFRCWVDCHCSEDDE